MILISICNFLSDLWNWIKPNSLYDLITSFCAVFMAYIAHKALGNWRKEKKHEVLIEAFAFRREALMYIYRIRDPYNTNWNENLKKYYERKNKLKNTIEKVNLIYEKLQFVLKREPEDSLLNYYKSIVEIDLDFDLKANKLDIIAKELSEKGMERKHYDKEYADLHNALYSAEIIKPGEEPEDKIYLKLYRLEKDLRHCSGL